MYSYYALCGPIALCCEYNNTTLYTLAHIWDLAMSYYSSLQSDDDDGDRYQYQYHHHHHHSHDNTHTKAAAPGGSGSGHRLLGGGGGGAEEELEGGGGGMAIVFDFTTRVTLFGATSTTRMDYAMLLVVAFGVACATEYVAHARRRHMYHHDNANNGQNGSSMTQGEGGGGGAYESATTLTMGHHHHHHHHHNHHQRVLHGAKYATHQLMSYVLMLCVMSLNFGILVSVILGLGVGNYAFNNAGTHYPRGGGRRRASSTLVSDAGCNPE